MGAVFNNHNMALLTGDEFSFLHESYIKIIDTLQMVVYIFLEKEMTTHSSIFA